MAFCGRQTSGAHSKYTDTGYRVLLVAVRYEEVRERCGEPGVDVEW